MLTLDENNWTTLERVFPSSRLAFQNAFCSHFTFKLMFMTTRIAIIGLASRSESAWHCGL